jgi:tRNA modification GTPase
MANDQPQTLFRDTIFALSSGRLPAGIAVVRISGPHAQAALLATIGKVPPTRMARYCIVRDAAGEELDRGLALFFPGPASETGEDIAELHLHGGKAIVSAVLKALGGIEGLRHAEAGEFTRRAYLNGKIDLTDAEALGDLVSAETEAQRRFAQANSRGRQAELYAAWRERLLHARAMIEAELDFADEADVPGSVAATVWADMETLTEDMAEHLAGYHSAEIIRDGFQVVILGAPNAGKSSLLNAIAKRDVAIVSEEAGTTRDLVEVALDLGGLKIILTDTAGIREQAGKVEQIGIERARSRARSADLILLLTPADRPAETISPESEAPVLEVLSKADLTDLAGGSGGYAVSARTGAGIAGLLDEIQRRAESAAGSTGDLIPSQARHVELIKRSKEGIERALKGRNSRYLEENAEEFRQAADSLGRIAGRIDVEDMLDAIFSHFCIGK